MQKLTFSVNIDAPVNHVWNVMLDLETYQQWASAFSEGSTYEGGWDEGNTIRFVGPEDEGEFGGLVAVVEANRANAFVSLRYTAELEGGAEKIDSPVVGMRESYSFVETAGGTTVNIELELPDEWAPMMSDMWPPALAELKRVAERP